MHQVNIRLSLWYLSYCLYPLYGSNKILRVTVNRCTAIRRIATPILTIESIRCDRLRIACKLSELEIPIMKHLSVGMLLIWIILFYSIDS